jgi:ribonuclease VapC
MVVDSSAVLAILLAEPEAERFARILGGAESVHMSAASYLEPAILIDNRRDSIASREFDQFLRRAEIVIEPVTPEQLGSRGWLIGILGSGATTRG